MRRSRFLGQIAGLWQYDIDFEAPAMVVQDADSDEGPRLIHITTEDGFNRGETRKEPDGSIIQEEFTV